MAEFLTTLEEFDLYEKLQFPHFSLSQKNIVSQKKLAYEILSRKEDNVMLVTSYGFEYSEILAGLSEKHIEYITNNGPMDYKENILKVLSDEKMTDMVFEITKAMDEDLGENVTQNQDRIKNVIQYIKDNLIVFEF